ncbi:hypothetical protein SK128_026248 [Halocaridina rubra]|uniref:Carbohydrate sulfotransferase n=1 Tax=Halocaridina rubra TaxID=373956 RepID=A0AAN8ZVS2_HALRR
MLTFTVVRHPLDRVLSTYRDKLELAKNPYFYTQYGQKIISNYRKLPPNMTQKQLRMYMQAASRLVASKRYTPIVGNPFTNPFGPTFSEFISYIIKAAPDNEHWRTYYMNCNPCKIHYDFILR